VEVLGVGGMPTWVTASGYRGQVGHRDEGCWWVGKAPCR
jgi:hypothetical protein